MRARYYGIKGRSGYVHAACFDAFVEAQAVRDTQGRIVRRPQIDALLYTAGHAGNGPCLHCGVSLAPRTPTPEKPIPIA
jgi:hypothetical protein